MHASPSSRGFTLIEILVALGIVVAMLFALAALVRLSVLQSTVHREEIALTIAMSTLEELRVGGYAALPPSGALAHPSLALLPGGAGTLSVSEFEDDTAEVEVTVTWEGRDGENRSMTLSTLITDIGGLL